MVIGILKEYKYIECKLMNLKVDLEVLTKELNLLNMCNDMEIQILNTRNKIENLNIEINNLSGFINKINNAIEGLEVLDQILIKEIYIKDNKINEICNKLNMARSTLNYNLSKAINKLSISLSYPPLSVF